MAKSYTYKEHYDCEFLLNSKDKNGLAAFVRIVCSLLRGPGKTYSLSGKLIERYFKHEYRFGLIVRDKGELGSIASGVLTPYMNDHYPNYSIIETVAGCKAFSRIYLESIFDEEEKTKELIGYGIALKGSDTIKKNSGEFSGKNVNRLFMDEFQTKGSYLKNEIASLFDIIKTVFRGGDSHKAVRDDCELWLASNTISFGNPYFKAFGLNKNIQSSTRFYRGDGVVFERCEVEGLQQMHDNSAANRAFASFIEEQNKNNDSIWIMDHDSLVEKIDGSLWGKGYYMCTISYNGNNYGVYAYDSIDRLYISKSVDKTCTYKYAMSLENNNLNLPLLKTNHMMQRISKYFYSGQLRVSHGEIQDMLIDCFG